MFGRNALRTVMRPAYARAGMATITKDACKLSGWFFSFFSFLKAIPQTLNHSLSYNKK
jgi:hypothetical protein